MMMMVFLKKKSPDKQDQLNVEVNVAIVSLTARKQDDTKDGSPCKERDL